MSSSLVWKSLQLLEADAPGVKGKKSSKSKETKNVKDLISTKRHGVKKEIKKLKREKKELKAPILGDKGSRVPSLKRSAGASTGCQTKDRTLENIKLLKQFSDSPPIELSAARKILERTSGQIIKLEVKKEDTNTVFTEADFNKFAKSYIPD